MSDSISKIIDPENIDVPGLVKILEGMEERIANIEEALGTDTTKGETALFSTLLECLESNPQQLGGALTFRGTRFSASQFPSELADCRT
jgi:hypothetical protein